MSDKLDAILERLVDAECTCCKRPTETCQYCSAMDQLVAHAKRAEGALKLLWDRYLLPITDAQKLEIQEVLGERPAPEPSSGRRRLWRRS